MLHTFKCNVFLLRFMIQEAPCCTHHFLPSLSWSECLCVEGAEVSMCEWQAPCTQHSPELGAWEGGRGSFPSSYTLSNKNTGHTGYLEPRFWHQSTAAEMSIHIPGPLGTNQSALQGELGLRWEASLTMSSKENY